MTQTEILERVKQWAEGNSSFLASRSEYSRGYKDGIQTAQHVISCILEGKDVMYYI